MLDEGGGGTQRNLDQMEIAGQRDMSGCLLWGQVDRQMYEYVCPG